MPLVCFLSDVVEDIAHEAEMRSDDKDIFRRMDNVSESKLALDAACVSYRMHASCYTQVHYARQIETKNL